MSEFSKTKDARLKKLMEVSHLLLEKGSARSFILDNEGFISSVIPSDFITLFDELVKEGIETKQLKPLSNKILNIFYRAIDDYESVEPEADSFLGVLTRNNREMEGVLEKIRPAYKVFVKNRNNESLQAELLLLFRELEPFVKHYTLKENVLFPVLEKTWPDYRCLQIMWSFHDDIRRNLRTVIGQLEKGSVDFKPFNRSVGDLFFNMLAIKFREERILFPSILLSIGEETLAMMTNESFSEPGSLMEKGQVNLGSGALSPEQISLVFNHLPVDITFVDEDDRVQYFSEPKERIFPRTKAVIGREVKNCHPPESVHVVERIIRSFKKGERDEASFWIKMKGKYLLIRYFAVRDEQSVYRGVVEVSQEISDIKAIEGEKRLLDW